MNFNKKRDCFLKKKLSESTGKPKDLWKALKSLGFPNKIYSWKVSALKANNTEFKNQLRFQKQLVLTVYLDAF